ELCAHRPCAIPLVELGEAVALVEADRRAVLRDAKRDRLVALRSRSREQGVHQLASEAAAAPAGNDGDRELGRLLVDEAVAGRVAPEEPVPGGADREALVERDHGGVAGASPVL